MNPNTIYHCDGGCAALAAAPTTCASPGCPGYGEALGAYIQCSRCVAAHERDQKMHWCEQCEQV